MKNDKYNVEIGKDYLIHIFNGSKAIYAKRKYGNDDNIIMEILYDYGDYSIISVNCILSVFMDNMDYKLPDYDTLNKVDENKLIFERWQTDEYFRVIFNKKEANIVLGLPESISNYYTNGRVDFYFNNEMKLCDIRVRDLTYEEYCVLFDEQYNYGNYMQKNNEKSK